MRLRHCTHRASREMGIRPDAELALDVPSVVIMTSGSVAVIAGMVSTAIFAASLLPMLIKAGRTKDLASYSRGNIVLANVGQCGAQRLRPPAAGRADLGAARLLPHHLGPDAAVASALRQGASGPRSDRSHQESTMTEHIETVIIGAGQAGLATAYHLHRCGRSSLILDGNARVGDNWRTHWDSLQLYSPAGSDGLPGMAFPGPKWSYPTKDQVADYLEAYAARFALPVRNRARVERLEFVHGRYAVRLGPETITADNVVVATGTFGRTPECPGVRPGSGSVDPPAALQRVPPPRPTPARSRPGRRCLAFGHRHRLRGGAEPSHDPQRPRSRCAAGPPRSLERPPVLAGVPVHGNPRVDSADADRSQGDGRDPVPRRAGPPAQTRRPDRTWGGAGIRAGHRRPQRAAADR